MVKHKWINVMFMIFARCRNISHSALFICLGLTSLVNIWGHIATVPTCSSGTLTNVLPHRNAMPQTQDMTSHPVTVYRHGADLSLCYSVLWNVTLEYTTIYFNVLGQTRSGNLSLTSHTHTSERSTLWCCFGGSQSGPVVCESITLSARPQLLHFTICHLFPIIET